MQSGQKHEHRDVPTHTHSFTKILGTSYLACLLTFREDQRGRSSLDKSRQFVGHTGQGFEGKTGRERTKVKVIFGRRFVERITSTRINKNRSVKGSLLRFLNRFLSYKEIILC